MENLGECDGSCTISWFRRRKAGVRSEVKDNWERQERTELRDVEENAERTGLAGIGGQRMTEFLKYKMIIFKLC